MGLADTFQEEPGGFTEDALDPRGHAYDPRFAPEPTTPDRIGKAAASFNENRPALAQSVELPAPSSGRAAFGGALQGITLGAFPMITAAISHPSSLVPGSDKTAYEQSKRDIQAELDKEKATHPVFFGGGELGGTALSSAILPGGALSKSGSKALPRIAQAAGMTGIASANDAIGHDKSLGEAAKAGAIGTGVGALFGAGGELLGRGLSSALGKKAGSKTAAQAFEQETLRDFASDSRPKDRRALSELFEHDLEKQPIAAPTIKPKDILYADEFRPILDLAKKGDREAVDTELSGIISKAGAANKAAYPVIDQAKPLSVGKPINDLDTAIFKLKAEHGESAAVKSLEEAKSRLEKTWSSMPVERLRDKLERFAGGDMSTDLQKKAIRGLVGEAPRQAPVPLNAPNRAYRGISGDELDYIVRNGKISSDMRYSLKHEGTSYSKDFQTAEDYTNFGRTNPEKTGKPNYVVEVERTPQILDNPDGDGYLKARPGSDVPASAIKRVWKFTSRNEAIPGKLGPDGWRPIGEPRLVNDNSMGWMHEPQSSATPNKGLLPEKGFITRADVVKALGDHAIDPKLRGIVEDIGFNFHPDAIRPVSELRTAVTKAQEDAFDTLGTIAETEHAKLKAVIKKEINRSLESHLNDVAKQSPELAKAVTDIRNSDVVQSTLIALRRNNSEAMLKGATQDIGRAKKGHVAGNVVGGLQLGEAAMAAFSGEPIKAAKHVAIAGLAKVAPEALNGITRELNEGIARGANKGGPVAVLIKAAQGGNAKAQALLMKLGIPGIGEDVSQSLGQATRVQAAKAAAPLVPAAASMVGQLTGNVGTVQTSGGQ
jgi:hypothetical protein